MVYLGAEITPIVAAVPITTRERDTTGRINNHRSQSNRISGRQQWIWEAQKLQGAYQRNAKCCVAQVTGEEKPRENCPIPMDTLTEWMANTATPTPKEKPSWLEEPSKNTRGRAKLSLQPQRSGEPTSAS